MVMLCLISFSVNAREMTMDIRGSSSNRWSFGSSTNGNGNHENSISTRSNGNATENGNGDEYDSDSSSLPPP